MGECWLEVSMLGERCTAARRQSGKRVTLSRKAEHVTARRPCWANTGRSLLLAFPASLRAGAVCICVVEQSRADLAAMRGRCEAARESRPRQRGDFVRVAEGVAQPNNK